MELLSLDKISKHFRPPVPRSSLVKWLTSTHQQHKERVVVLNSISLKVYAGESIGIIGRNGSGKSTLLKIMAGILQPSTGTLKVNGEVLPLFSWDACFIDDLEIRDNLFLFGAMIGLPTRKLSEIIPKLAAAEGMQDRLDNQMRIISPGMRARFALRLADHTPAQVILIDETLSAGDNNFRQACRERLQEWKSRGKAIIHVSHDMDLVRTLSDRCLIMENGTLKEITDVKHCETLGDGS